MPLSSGICDSCGQKTDVLFPIGILDELPSGGEGMVQRWYCLKCRKELEDEAEQTEDNDSKGSPLDEEPEDKDNDFTCNDCPDFDRAKCKEYGNCRKEHNNDANLP